MGKSSGELEQCEIIGGGIAQQVPGKADLGHVRESKFEGYPQKWSADASEEQAALCQTANRPRECAGENAEDRSDEKQNRTATDAGEAAMHCKNCGNPGHGGQ